MTQQEIFPFFGGEAQWNFLQTAQKEKRVAGSYIFIGPEHVGRETLAKRFVSLFFCKALEKPCLECGSCRSIHKGEHPGLFLLEGNSINISEIRELQDFVSLKSLLNDYRFVLFRNIDRVNRFSANALLKIFEEPPENLVFLSIAEGLNGILPTLQSRSQIIRILRGSDKLMEDIYRNHNPEREFPSPYFLSWIGGKSGRMIDFLKNSQIWEEHEKLYKELTEMLLGAEEGKLPNNKYFSDKEKSKEILAVLEEIGRRLYFSKIQKESSPVLAKKTRESLRTFLVRILKAQMLLKNNVSPSVLFDQIFCNF